MYAKLLAASALSALLAACASGPTVRADGDPSVNLASYKTFAFFDNLATDRSKYSTMLTTRLKDSTRRDGEARDEGSDDGTPCSCPFPCSAGCAGYLGRVLVQASSVALVEPAPELAVLAGPDLAEPANPDPSDILHVPKRIVA